MQRNGLSAWESIFTSWKPDGLAVVQEMAANWSTGPTAYIDALRLPGSDEPMDPHLHRLGKEFAEILRWTSNQSVDQVNTMASALAKLLAIKYYGQSDSDPKTQFEELHKQNSTTCGGSCKQSFTGHALYRCFYCGVWFCAPCAELHFGNDVFAEKLSDLTKVVPSVNL